MKLGNRIPQTLTIRLRSADRRQFVIVDNEGTEYRYTTEMQGGIPFEWIGEYRLERIAHREGERDLQRET